MTAAVAKLAVKTTRTPGRRTEIGSAHLLTTLLALLVVALVWLIVGQVVRAADALLPACNLTSDGSQSPMCATPSNTPNR